MPNQAKCPTCNGGGKVDNRDGKPWADITARRNPEVSSGALLPVPCPKCRGTGKERAEAAAPAIPTPALQAPPSANPSASAGQVKKPSKL